MDQWLSRNAWLFAEARKMRRLAHSSDDAALSAHLVALAEEFERAGWAAMPDDDGPLRLAG